jgi:hypothetical protein
MGRHHQANVCLRRRKARDASSKPSIEREKVTSQALNRVLEANSSAYPCSRQHTQA